MKKNYTLFLVAIFTLAFQQITAQEIWTGPVITFEKADGADWTLEENQDRITDSVWITRTNNKGIFNIAKEEEYQGDGDQNFGPSPVGTEWAFGTTGDGIENLSFMTWVQATVDDGLANPPTLVGQDMVVHLTVEDIYIDIKFLSWANGGQGGMGGFSYERATNDISDVGDIVKGNATLSVFPNPARGELFIKDLQLAQNIEIFNLLGESVYLNNIDSSDPINTNAFPAGTYIVRSEDGRTATLVVE